MRWSRWGVPGVPGWYWQREEGGIAPNVVFEALLPGSTPRERARKRAWPERCGVEASYQYDHDPNFIEGRVSPRSGIRFEPSEETLAIREPGGRPFVTDVELARPRDEAEQRAEAESQRAGAERQRAERLLAQLRALGIEPPE
jgi:hypothetical protein